MIFKENRLVRSTERMAWALLEHIQSDAEGGTRYLRFALRYYTAHWDLLPDFIPGLGMLDDWLVLKLAVRSAGVTPSELPEGMDRVDLHNRIRAALHAGPSLPASG